MKQSFAWWSFTMGLDEGQQRQLLAEAADIGFGGVEMAPEAMWPVAREVGIEPLNLIGHDIERGFNDPARHRELFDGVAAAIDTAAAGEVPMVIVFSGNHVGDDQDTAIGHCVDGLAALADRAHETGVTLLLELLNSKVDHPGYQCDNSAFGFEVVRRVGSPGLRVLFDLYHMQLMEGDLSRTVQADLDLIGHFHTAGVPGRSDLDDRQEVNWRAIAGLLRHLDYQGWVGHEFMPRSPAVDALGHAFSLFA